MSTRGINFSINRDKECVCVVCGKKFLSTRKSSKLCSQPCRAQLYNTSCSGHGELIKTCVVCGKEFKTYRSRKLTCSEQCAKERSREVDRINYKKLHPDAPTKEERLNAYAKAREEKAKDHLRLMEERKAEREAKRNEEKAKREAEKQARINYWQNYSAEHTCCICGKTFIAKYPTTKYCSDRCVRKAHKVKKRYVGITIDKGITLEVLAERDNQQCQICGLLVDWEDKAQTDKVIICGDMYPSIDHIKPISRGGLHSWDNVQLAHRKCNTFKSNKLAI